MDFAALMGKELSKGKKTASDSSMDSKKQFLKRSEVEAERKREYLAEQVALEQERAAKAAAKRKLEEDTATEREARDEKRRKLAEESRRRREEQDWEEEQARRRRLGLPEQERPGEGADGDEAVAADDVPDEELFAKLRELGHPVVLFGETHAGRLRRYRKASTVLTDGPIPMTLRLVDEKDMKVDAGVPRDAEARAWLYRQLASYFTMVLSTYQRTMEQERRDTSASKTAYNAMLQTIENMKPLFRRFEAGDLDDSLLEPVVEIVKALQERRYVDANDGYLRLSIGKAAWPIGVTMVGIHERSAREKLHDGEKGHVMGDEVTRKFLQSIKRCLTFAQVRWPPEDLRQLMG
ncbi:potassium channel regulatory factor [Cordyceps fumosorosea ARSEF 2679]|uniref:Pre-mRNA-splicing factor 18 n=1 Tax=Cordyceps fumosorosea (strain ARSEF 2679) TaxID=1081104 RepID=A0A168B889_CORFA|nr:potassium channel regulatory factor [Cordyceps fumosorosea ARSEF 2679]OAA69757.1 potassium channel regulatory factor [Cordyceps fumosorosea ARSEF 2679]